MTQAKSTTPPPTASIPSAIQAAKPSLLARILSAPTHTMVLILSILAGLVLVLLIVAVVVKLQVQYLEVIGGGLALYARSILLTVLFLGLSLLVVWTTRVEELPVAFARIAAPLRKLGAPVDEWAHTLALTVRTLPLLRDEIRVLIAARRLRPQPRAASRRARITARGREVLDLVVAIVASAGRRASDLGRAATQRGGMQSAD